jgi:lipoprotein-releasing system permease protein
VSIATVGVALGMTVMLLAVAIVKGFQHEVRELVIGFGSHVQILNMSDNLSGESGKVSLRQDFYPSLADKEGIKHIQPFASKAGILETTEHIQGVVIKGINKDFDWSFIEPRITKGQKLNLNDSVKEEGILISAYLANRLEIDTASKVTLYFISGKEDISPRNFKVKGIFHTGLEEFDRKYIFCDMGYIQKLSGWGLQLNFLTDSCRDGQMSIEATAFGGGGDYDYEWPETGWKGKGPHTLCVNGNQEISCILSDDEETLQDTAWLKITSPYAAPGICSCDGMETTYRTSGGSEKYYCGGFEVMIEDYSALNSMDEILMYEIPHDLKTVTVQEQQPEIFSWLEVLDMNVIVIIGMMILVSVINMASALLIIILERTSMIGALKAFGIQDFQVVQIFLYHAFFILGRGMLIGNLIALAFAWLQVKFHIISLDPDNYYVKEVPVKILWQDFAFLNLGTLLISLILLIIPALYVTTIAPARAVRFD